MKEGEYIILKISKLDSALDKEVKLGKMSKIKAKNIKKHLLYLSCKTDPYDVVEDAFNKGLYMEFKYADDYLKNLEL